MKKLFALVALAGLGLGTIGCGEAPKPMAKPEAKPEAKPDGGAAPAPGGEAKPTEGAAPAPAAPEEKKP